jgi:hypothetical protein
MRLSVSRRVACGIFRQCADQLVSPLRASAMVFRFVVISCGASRGYIAMSEEPMFNKPNSTEGGILGQKDDSIANYN